MSKPSILMIENDLPTIELYRGLLQQDYDVLAHSDESEILDLLSRFTPDVIILEPAMNNGLGWQIFTVIYAVMCEHPVPVIVCTTSDERKRGLEMGAAAFLVKPVLPSLLLQTLGQLQTTGCKT
ncbi:MAG: response regulator [Anaerolineae bacterium]|nr:response regulator [Anaerolineae bacterium]